MTTQPDDAILYTTARGMFGTELRRLREQAGLSLSQLGEIANCDKTYLSRIERAEKFPKEAVAEALDDAVGAGGLLNRLWYLATSGSVIDYVRRFMQLEVRATKMHQFLCDTVPGLLQTEDYARRLIGEGMPSLSEERIEGLVVARLARQQRLRQEKPPLYWAVLDESAIRRPVGNPSVMADQLARVVQAAGQPRVVIQVLPFSAGAHASPGGSLTLLSFAHDPDVAYLEGSHIGKLVESREDVAEHSLRLDLIRAKALSPEASVAFLQQATEEYRQCASSTDTT
ncbi:helix-turn-helix domain-containing protein [Streptomyces sp. NPDC001970]